MTTWVFSEEVDGGPAPISLELLTKGRSLGGDVAVTRRRFELLPNVPNPFNPRTAISFVLPRYCEQTLERSRKAELYDAGTAGWTAKSCFR